MGRNFFLVPSGAGHNYTGMLTRSIVFSTVLFVFLAATGMTIAAIIVPEWLGWDSTVTHDHHTSHLHKELGLHKQCTTKDTLHVLDHSCTAYPRYEDCRGSDRYFCSMWRSVGFLMSFSVVLEGMTIAAFIILLSNKQKREQGWKFMATMAGLAATVQLVATALVGYLRDNDEKFAVPGWSFDKSWSLATASWTLQYLVAGAIILASTLLPSEGGYELIPDRRQDEEDY